MKDIKEVVDLPSAKTKPLVHPLDVAPARKPYLASRWLHRLASLPVAFLFGVVLWVISNNVVTPLVVPILVFALATLAAEFYTGQAWHYIPRNRQDGQRESAALPQLVGSVIDVLALVSGLLLLINWASESQFSEPVEEFVMGIGAGIAIVQLGQLITALARRRLPWVALISQALTLAAVVVAVLVASVTLVEDQWSTESLRIALMGAALMLAIQLLLWLIQLIGHRRAAITRKVSPEQ